MNKISYWNILKDTLKKQKSGISIYFSCVIFCYLVFRLYNFDITAFLYVFSVIAWVLIFIICVSFIKNVKAYNDRKHLKESILLGESLIKPSSLCEEDYNEIISILITKMNSISSEYEKEFESTDEYISTWVHQIKTPISVMRMIVAEKDGPEYTSIKNELFRIEEYVDMLLQYIRIDSKYNDLVIKEQNLDDIIRKSIRKYAPLFIMKKLNLNYDGTDTTAITDSKWLSIILDQILSNAIKYTNEGCISIQVEDNTIRIIDTGIGIAKEDLPCIFEKGYTGKNGRANDKASGLGLFLAKKASNMLSIKLNVSSEIGKGSCFEIVFPNNY